MTKGMSAFAGEFFIRGRIVHATDAKGAKGFWIEGLGGERGRILTRVMLELLFTYERSGDGKGTGDDACP